MLTRLTEAAEEFKQEHGALPGGILVGVDEFGALAKEIVGSRLYGEMHTRRWMALELAVRGDKVPVLVRCPRPPSAGNGSVPSVRR